HCGVSIREGKPPPYAANRSGGVRNSFRVWGSDPGCGGAWSGRQRVTQASIQGTHSHIEIRMAGQPVSDARDHPQVVSHASAQRHAFAQSFLDGVDARVASAARLAMARLVAEPGEP